MQKLTNFDLSITKHIKQKENNWNFIFKYRIIKKKILILVVELRYFPVLSHDRDILSFTQDMDWLNYQNFGALH